MPRSNTRSSGPVLLGLLCALTYPAVARTADTNWQKEPDGLTLHLEAGSLRLQVLTPRIVHVTYSPAGSHPAESFAVLPQSLPPVKWHLASDPRYVTLVTDSLQAKVDRTTGAVRFLNVKGEPILNESGRMLKPITLAGPIPQSSFQTEQRFAMAPGESYYGLGQHQDGWLDYRNHIVRLEQTNREVGIPFLVSSRGYGLLMDNPSAARIAFGVGDGKMVASASLVTADGKPGGLTAEYFQGRNFQEQNRRVTRIDPQIDFNWKDAPAEGLGKDDFSVRWTGFVKADEGGGYTFQTSSDDGIRLWVDDKPVIDDWNVHAERVDTAKLHFESHSRHRIRMEFFQDRFDAIARLTWLRPRDTTRTLAWANEAASAIDYYFVYGPALDDVIAGERKLTGKAPLPPKWALGFWQSKERYNTQQEWLDIAKEYRTRGLPIDNLVQDWFYWNPHPWGSHLFDAARYSDPAADIAALHDQYHLHFMISVWGKFAPGTPDNPDANYDALSAKGYLYPELGEHARYYDAFNPQARKLYWDEVRSPLFDKGVDAWWLDASEPEVNMQGFRQTPTARGLGATVLNAWPLMHTTSVYQGQRQVAPNKRVFILTRSAYAGQQRNGAATWSGDITAGWQVFANQIPAGLNFCLSGIPYWTTDIGGFFIPRDLYPGGSSNPAYAELFTRWFEYGAFCPIFRVHGTDTAKELWRFGPEAEKILHRYDDLRYRLMPYIYSQSWQVAENGDTLMRALPMNFPADPAVRDIKDEFMFGSSLLVCPVTESGALTRSVTLPAGTVWTDFWTGQTMKGGQTTSAAAPLETMPLYVRAGSIIPMGPYLQYVAEKPADPIELRVYPGANGTFTLYEDDGVTNDYERGVFSTIPLGWDEKTHTLTLGKRLGKFPGMLAQRTFRIVLVESDQGVGIDPTKTPDRVVTYRGNPLKISFPR